MVTEITVSVAVEGQSDVEAARQILGAHGAHVGRLFVANGKQRLDAQFAGYNRAAAHGPWLVIRDADRDGGDCPVRVRSRLLGGDKEATGMCLRLAVRSIESWLLADRDAAARFLGLRVARLPEDPDTLFDPKRWLVDEVRRSTKPAIRSALVPTHSSGAPVGPLFATTVSEFFRNHWRPERASLASPSLDRALQAVGRLVESSGPG